MTKQQSSLATRLSKFLNECAILEGEPIMLGFMAHNDLKLLMAAACFEEPGLGRSALAPRPRTSGAPGLGIYMI